MSLSIIIGIEKHVTVSNAQKGYGRHHVLRGSSCHVAKLPFGWETQRAKRLSQPALDARSITASFRDPAGSLFRYHGLILRVVNVLGAADPPAFLAAPSGRKLMDSGAVVPAQRLDDAEDSDLLADSAVRELYQARGGQMILDHGRIDFATYPYLLRKRA